MIWLLYSSWDKERDRQRCLSFWAILCSFTPSPKNSKNQNFEKIKKLQEISSCYTCVPKIKMIRSTVPEIWSVTGWNWQCWIIFCPLTHLKTPKTRILKKWKNLLKISSLYTQKIVIIRCMVLEIWSETDSIFGHFGPVFEDHMMYGSWDMVCNGHNFCHYGPFFCHYTPLMTRIIKILIKWKKHLEMVLFYICVPSIMIIWCMVPEIRSATDRIFCNFGLFFALLPPNDSESQNYEKMKKSLDIPSFYTCVPKIMITWCTVPETWQYNNTELYFLN